MAKNNRPTIDNPLASMGLDDIVRGITASGNDTEAVTENANEISETPKKTGKPRRGGKKAFVVTDYVRLRKTGHITQQELADQSKVIRQTISRIENFVTSPQLDTMLKLLESMGYTLKIVPIKDRK